MSETKSINPRKKINYILRENDIALAKIRPQCYDGAVMMRRNAGGVQQRMEITSPLAVCVHCISHSLNLAIKTALFTIVENRTFFSFKQHGEYNMQFFIIG